MSVVRRMVYTRPHAMSTNEGPRLFEKCPCGKDRRTDTLEHVELERVSLEELLERYGEAPCVAQHDEKKDG